MMLMLLMLMSVLMAMVQEANTSATRGYADTDYADIA